MGKFIVLEGLDGVGKTTLAQGLAEKLGGVYMSTPGDPFAECRAFIIDAMGDDQLGRALFYASTVSAQGRQALRQVTCGCSVIMDRYWPSTVAYAKARGVDVNLEALTPGFAVPDLVVLITLDEKERRSRLSNRSVTAEDLETLCLNFTQSVLSQLERRCELQVDITGMNQTQSIEHLAMAIQGYFTDSMVVSGV
jgi:dTMP kinase